MHWWLAALALAPSFAGKRKQADAPEGFQEMRVEEVVVLPDGALVVLADVDEARVIAMVVGPTEGQTIYLRQERRAFERPLTHDLFDQILGLSSAEILEVRVDDVRAGTYVARVTIQTRRRKRHTLDARASDSIAMALGRGLPIWVADHVVDAEAVHPEQLRRVPEEPEKAPVDDPHDAL